MTSEGRALSRASGSGFVAEIWLENDGEPVPQDAAGGRDGFLRGERQVRAEVSGLQVLQVTGKTALAALEGCDGADLLVSNQVDVGARPCLAYGLAELRASGALAVSSQQDGGIRVTTARGVAGARPWNAAFGPPMQSFDVLP